MMQTVRETLDIHGYLVCIQTFECVNTCFGLSVHHIWHVGCLTWSV